MWEADNSGLHDVLNSGSKFFSIFQAFWQRAIFIFLTKNSLTVRREQTMIHFHRFMHMYTKAAKCDIEHLKIMAVLFIYACIYMYLCLCCIWMWSQRELCIWPSSAAASPSFISRHSIPVTLLVFFQHRSMQTFDMISGFLAHFVCAVFSCISCWCPVLSSFLVFAF